MPKRGSLERADVQRIIKQAHEVCKDKVGVTVGKKRLTRSREDYLKCLKETIRDLIKKELSGKGIKVAKEVG
jgi:hypothetical protein